MVLLLVGDVLAKDLDVARAYRKCSVPGLPIEVGERSVSRLYPLRRLTFELLDQLGDRNGAPKAAHDMNVIGGAANSENWAVELLALSAEEGMHLLANGAVVEEWPPVLRRKHDVQVDL